MLFTIFPPLNSAVKFNTDGQRLYTTAIKNIGGKMSIITHNTAFNYSIERQVCNHFVIW